jgi:hypothetical protein
MAVDPEDLQAHYNLMLCYKGLGDDKQAHEHELRYMRFKADESAQAITGPYRQLNPEDNNERQAIHEHISVPLGRISVVTSNSKSAHSKLEVFKGRRPEEGSAKSTTTAGAARYCPR